MLKKHEIHKIRTLMRRRDIRKVTFGDPIYMCGCPDPVCDDLEIYFRDGLNRWNQREFISNSPIKRDLDTILGIFVRSRSPIGTSVECTWRHPIKLWIYPYNSAKRRAQALK